MLLQLDQLTKRIGARTLFAGVDLQIQAGDRIGLVGPNGAGKTTLLRIAAGLDHGDGGDCRAARGARVALLRQEIDPGGTQSAREETAKALAPLAALEAEMRALEDEMSRAEGAIPEGLAERYDNARHRFEVGGGFEREARIERVLTGLGFDESHRERPLEALSGGWLMRVELAKLLLAEPDVLLLDEPTNHLDLPSIQWFEETLASYPGGVVVISHDRTFLRRQVKRVAELANGRFTIYEGGYDKYLVEREQRRAELEARKQAQDRKIAETERFIERFRAKASKARQVQSRVKALDKLERIELMDGPARRMRLKIPEPQRAGAVPLRLEGVHKRYGDNVVYRGVDVQIARGDCVALVGPNGAGKSTLLRILAGTLPFDEGERTLGHQAQVAFYAQHQLEALEMNRTVLAELETVAKTDDVPRLRGHLGAFLFSGDDVEKKVSVLSGGEKARLALAKMLLRPANVLVLDEPTNHLDVEACEILENALGQYQGTLVLISHDRAFINALATRVIEVRDGVLREFIGNYDDYLRKLGEGAAAAQEAADRPDAPGAAKTPATATPGEAPKKPQTKAERAAARERRKERERIARKVEKLEAEILEREQAVEALGWKLGDPEVYKDADAVRTAEAERTALKDEIAAHYKEWERLAAELEVLGDADA